MWRIFFYFTIFLTNVLAEHVNTTTSPLNITTTTIKTTTSYNLTTTAPITTIKPPTTHSNGGLTTKKYKFTKTTIGNQTTKYASVATAAALSIANKLYCEPSLCNWYNGSALVVVPHIGCQNNGTFENTCGKQPHLLYMNERRRNLILDMHNLARSRIASGQLLGFKPATHMPLLKWDNELEFLATFHVKRCRFAHDQCRNTQKYRFSGQNIAYYWIARDFRSHSRRIKSFIVDWFREYNNANQSFIDNFQLHPDKKKPIGHFTQLVADRVHRVGCAAVRFRDVENNNLRKFLMTCNYDYTNIFDEPIYQSGIAASKCAYKLSEKYPALCDWKDANYDYDSEESEENDNLIGNNILSF